MFCSETLQAPMAIAARQLYCIPCVLGQSKISWNPTSVNGEDDDQPISPLPFIRCDELDFGFCVTAETADLSYKLARQFHDRNQITAAICQYRKTLAQSPGHFEAMFCLASALLTENACSDEAVEIYRQAITSANFDLNPGSPDLQTAGRAFNNLGVALLQQESFDDAISLWTQAVALDADCVLAHVNVGNFLLYHERDPDGAAVAYRHATRAAPHFAQAHANLGLVLGKLGDASGAIEAYRRAMDINPHAFGAALAVICTCCDLQPNSKITCRFCSCCVTAKRFRSLHTEQQSEIQM